MHGERGDPAVAQGVETHLAADGVGQAEPAADPFVDVRRVELERGRVKSQVPKESVAEDQPPYGRVDPVRAHEQVGLDHLTGVQRDPYPVVVLVDTGERGAEAHVQVTAQHPFQVGPHDAEQPALDRLFELGVHDAAALVAVFVQQQRLPHVVCHVLDGRQQAHGLDRVEARAEEVDHVPLGARPR
ncbi:hypothetical protein GCM10029964_028270 [Kibdelosporangium lantanae]